MACPFSGTAVAAEILASLECGNGIGNTGCDIVCMRDVAKEVFEIDRCDLLMKQGRLIHHNHFIRGDENEIVTPIDVRPQQ